MIGKFSVKCMFRVVNATPFKKGLDLKTSYVIKSIVFLSRLQSVSRDGSVSVLRRLLGGYSSDSIQKVTQEPNWVFRACK